ncbi:MAG: hypothetical protein JWL61_4283 [Gemmatimonadetes bacterium]|nr:hypothetical protein [Gemmatimonadota bacterium]
MKDTRSSRTCLALLVVAALSCATHVPAAGSHVEKPPARYLFTWAGDEGREDSDFLAVIDLARDGDRYGTIVATTPVGETGVWPHHTEHDLGASQTLFANGFSGNRSFVFDLHDALHPRVVQRFDGVAGLSFLHSFTRLPNGHVLATFQAHGPENLSPGGIAEIDEAGHVVRSASAADSSADQTTLRPYSLAVVPALDRVVVALTYMSIPSWHPLRPSIAHDHSGNQVQVFRLSDLTLIKTIRLPTSEAPNEPRVLKDGRTVLVNTGECRLYHVTGLEGTNPQMELIHQEMPKGCAMPVVIGDYWVQANAPDHRVFSLDIHDLKNVRAVSSVSFDERQRPHWLATDGSRIVVVNEPAPTAERRMWMLQVNRATGELSLDRDFRDAGSSRPGIAFDRHSWPHGATGNAVPHGTVFEWR